MGNVGARSANGGAKDDPSGGGLPSGEDDELVKACNQFLAVHEACVKFGGNADTAASFAEPHQYRLNERRRLDALREVTHLAPNTPLGLEAKFGVLCSLRSWMGSEDPRLTNFAIELVEDYRTQLLEHVAADEGGGRPPRSNGLLPPLRGLSRILRDALHLRAPA